MDLVLIDRGHRLPLTDLTVAALALALRLDAAVYTTDPHFDLVRGRKRFVTDARE